MKALNHRRGAGSDTAGCSCLAPPFSAPSCCCLYSLVVSEHCPDHGGFLHASLQAEMLIGAGNFPFLCLFFDIPIFCIVSLCVGLVAWPVEVCDANNIGGVESK